MEDEFKYSASVMVEKTYLSKKTHHQYIQCCKSRHNSLECCRKLHCHDRHQYVQDIHSHLQFTNQKQKKLHNCFNLLMLIINIHVLSQIRKFFCCKNYTMDYHYSQNIFVHTVSQHSQLVISHVRPLFLQAGHSSSWQMHDNFFPSVQ